MPLHDEEFFTNHVMLVTSMYAPGASVVLVETGVASTLHSPVEVTAAPLHVAVMVHELPAESLTVSEHDAHGLPAAATKESITPVPVTPLTLKSGPDVNNIFERLSPKPFQIAFDVLVKRMFTTAGEAGAIASVVVSVPALLNAVLLE